MLAFKTIDQEQDICKRGVTEYRHPSWIFIQTVKTGHEQSHFGQQIWHCRLAERPITLGGTRAQVSQAYV